MPDISIIIPAYNSAPWTGDMLRSVLEQPGVNFEVIFADDGSTDGSLEVASSRSDERCTVLRFNKNIGVARVRNAALSFARAEWICPFDADDVSCCLDGWRPIFCGYRLRQVLSGGSAVC